MRVAQRKVGSCFRLNLNETPFERATANSVGLESVTGVSDMANPSATTPVPLEHPLGMMEKQSRRIAELARFLPFAEQEKEMERMARELKVAIAAFRVLLESQ